MEKNHIQSLSSHWADLAALQVFLDKGDKEIYVVASGITPSGKVHVGNFREVITVDLVARALRSLGKQVKFIYSWDNFDTFRKTPKNLPDPKSFEPYLRQPIARIPDPWGKSSSYAKTFIDAFEEELSQLGINPDFRYQEANYSSGLYAEYIREALEKKDEIRRILDAHRTSPLSEDWLPTSIYCTRCQKDETEYERYGGGWDYEYRCALCGHEERFDIRESRNIKLAWRVDWPMRWGFEGVDFEPGGKDHSSQGGSFDTAKEIIRSIWGKEPPVYLQYDFVMIKGGAGKMSSSSGELYTLSQVLEVYEPQIIRWIFASHKPNHDFSISFDEDVIRIYDEFDEMEREAFGLTKEEKDAGGDEGRKQWLLRNYELSSLGGQLPPEGQPPPQRAKFRLLCTRLQACGKDIERTFNQFYSKELSRLDYPHFVERAKRAAVWLEKYAPQDFRYTLHERRVAVEMTAEQEKGIEALRALLLEIDLETVDPKTLGEQIWERSIKACSCDSKSFFRVVYQKLMGRDQGPRLPSFLKEIGKDKILELI
ncbi:MAG: lysine--tRNA ligase [Oligoflexales bacterium]|nr:lysine--tRNA ligase [Oligoflexales bacterium]